MIAIQVCDLHKTFRIPHERRTTLTERVLHLFRPVPYERFQALCGVDLEVEYGSFTGIIGSNGSGKSTLLKVIAGLLVPDAGDVRVEGSVAALLELGLGFSPELTVRENVELYGAVLGFPRRDMRSRVETAVQFADLERFRDAKLKNLSTGMQMRLGFATALQAANDILLLDEILAVGDASFQSKCHQVFADLKARRRTVVLVSHDLAQVRRLCDRAVLLEAGRVAASGDPETVIACYLEGTGTVRASDTRAHEGSVGDGRVRVREGWLENAAGTRVTSVRSGGQPTLVVMVNVVEDTVDPIYGALIRDRKGALIYATNTLWLGLRTGTVLAGQSIEIRMSFLAALRNGPYTVDAVVADRTGAVVHDWVHSVTSFDVSGSTCREGGADLQAELRWHVLAARGESGRTENARAVAGRGHL